MNSNDPYNIIASAAGNAWKSHHIQDLESFLYRRSSDEKQWNLITDGKPNPKGTVISILESNPNIGDEFYCLNNRGIYCSKDSGISWEILEISCQQNINRNIPGLWQYKISIHLHIHDRVW